MNNQPKKDHPSKIDQILSLIDSALIDNQSLDPKQHQSKKPF